MINKQDLLKKAITLSEVYGNKLEIVVYTQGVGISARLRLEKLGFVTRAKDFAYDLYKDLINRRLNDESFAWKNDNRAGLLWLDDLYEITGDKKNIEPIIDQANMFIDTDNSILDDNIQVEDQFFVSAILGRAFKYTNDNKYLDFMISHLLNSPLQKKNGIYVHSKISPFAWGRGNGFACYGAIEAIKYIPQNHYLREEVIAKHHKHLRALIPLQSSNGGWRQVIDVENSYEELTATCMIGYSLANNIKLGLLTKENIDILYKAWNFVDQKIENTGIVHDSCTGTGSMPTLNDYLIRKRENGFDNRGGSLAAWFLVSLYEILI